MSEKKNSRKLIVMGKWGSLQYSVSFYVCLNFSILKKLKNKSYKNQNRKMFFLILNTCAIKGRVSLTIKEWTQSQMGRGWSKASSVCAEQTELGDTKAQQQQPANAGPRASPSPLHTQHGQAYLPRRWAPSEDTQDPQRPLPTQSRRPSAPIPIW